MRAKNKPRMKIKNWWLAGCQVFGEVDDHPRLGPCKGFNVLASSSIVSVETQNSIYELDGPMREQDPPEKQMLKRDDDLE